MVDYCWFRGGWFDGTDHDMEYYFKCETKSNPPVESGAPGASLFVPFTLKPGETKIIRLMMAWYVPNTKLKYGKDPEGKPARIAPQTPIVLLVKLLFINHGM